MFRVEEERCNLTHRQTSFEAAFLTTLPRLHRDVAATLLPALVVVGRVVLERRFDML